MKVTPKEDIKSKGRLYEEGSPIDTEKQGIPDERVERWYAHGLVEIEGRDAAPERQVRRAVVQPHSTRHKQKESKHG